MLSPSSFSLKWRGVVSLSSSGQTKTPVEVDIITAKRSAQPRLDAIYILMPTSQNVELILRDYRVVIPPVQPSGSSSKLLMKKKEVVPVYSNEPPKYAGAHLHFVDGELKAVCAH